MKKIKLLKCLLNLPSLFLILGLACQPAASEKPIEDVGDAGQPSARGDSGTTDTQTPITDAGSGSATFQPAAGFGTITGDCGILTAALLSQTDALMVQNAIDFENDPYDDGDFELLTEGGQEIIDDGNAIVMTTISGNDCNAAMAIQCAVMQFNTSNENDVSRQ